MNDARSEISERARRVHEAALVWDDHSGFGPHPEADLDQLDHWARAGVSYLSVNVGYDVISWQETVKNIAAFLTWLEKRPDRFSLIRSVEDILTAKRQGKLAIAFDIEGMNALDGEARMVSLYYRLGVRQMLFAYNRNNLAAGGCHDEDGGLSDFGRRVIAEMNRVGMLVDCSHTGYRSTMEAMEVSAAPVIFSHSNPKALNGHGRNILDEQAKACAGRGGVIGVNGVGLFHGDREARTSSLLRAVDYLADLVGIDHVGIGLDWTFEDLTGLLELNPHYWPEKEGYREAGKYRFAAPAQLPELTELMLDRGYGETDVVKVLGGNFLRIAGEVWK